MLLSALDLEFGWDEIPSEIWLRSGTRTSSTTRPAAHSHPHCSVLEPFALQIGCQIGDRLVLKNGLATFQSCCLHHWCLLLLAPYYRVPISPSLIYGPGTTVFCCGNGPRHVTGWARGSTERVCSPPMIHQQTLDWPTGIGWPSLELGWIELELGWIVFC